MAHLDCGALLQMGPTWGRKSEEWVLTFGFPVTDTKRFDKEALPPRIRQLLKLPDLEMEVLHISHWVLDRVVADKYRVGRVFIAGDAAHRRPPTTGLGLNTGIEDARNIAWKLGSVLGEKADPHLLDTYESERRPIGIRNSDWAFFTFGNMQVLTAGVGLIPGAKEFNHQRFVQIFEDSEHGRAQLHHIRRVLSTQDVEYSAHDIELGFRYDDGACIPDGTDAPVSDAQGQTYIPTTRPGHRLPHAWIEKDGKKISTHDLICSGDYDFFIITDEDGSRWVEAADKIAETTNLNVGGAKIRARPHSKPAGLCLDFQDTWINLREVKDGGAILIRPDNFVAWRSHRMCDDPEKELRGAFATLLKQTPKETSSPDAAIKTEANGIAINRF
jgi:2,4-dichlorophenol 6-monooxygenase